ncbi:MAG: hypothetical protein ACR2JW_17580 [Thermomicrobiales bacterium]
MYESIVMVHAIMHEQKINQERADRRAFHGPDMLPAPEKSRHTTLLSRVRRTMRASEAAY